MVSDAQEVKTADYRRFVRQEANTRWLSTLKVPLALYRMSGTDSTRHWNRFFHRIGEAPVIYDSSLTDYSCRSIAQTLQGRGYLGATVTADTVSHKRRTTVTYNLHPGNRSFVSQLHYEFDNPYIEAQVLSGECLKESTLHRGMPFDVVQLDQERKRIIRHLRNNGYYALNQEFITYQADTLTGDYSVSLTLQFRCPAGLNPDQVYRRYQIGQVRIFEGIVDTAEADSSTYHNVQFYKEADSRRHLARRVLLRNNFIRPGMLFAEKDLQNTYQSLNSLDIIHYTSIHQQAHPDSIVTVPDSLHPLDADIYVKFSRRNTISMDVEGTNTAGDLGVAASLSYNNRNLFRGAEVLQFKVRGAFEAIKGLEGYSDSNYTEYGGELALRIPRFLLSFGNRMTEQVRATTEFSLLYNSQDRPEFHRRVWTGAWNYQWTPLRNNRFRHRLDLFSLNYLYMPWISQTFRKEYLDDTSSRNSILRYSYEDLFIMKVGYVLHINSLSKSGVQGLYNTNGYQIRMSAEAAGTLLYGIARTVGLPKNSNGEYVIGNIPFSQYVKFDLDYSKSLRLTENSSLAFHGAVGVAIPLGNSTMIPYEKRYFSGGANSVRGWNVRELGPGSFVGKDGKVDFINQTGNLKLDLSIEYRAHLFWKFDGAAFIDAGNIWNTRNYEGLERGQFHWDSFARQIAVAYGLGVRLNFNFFILRFDGGMKAINPAAEQGRLHYPLIHPNFKRDFAFHFAVGLPF